MPRENVLQCVTVSFWFMEIGRSGKFFHVGQFHVAF